MCTIGFGKDHFDKTGTDGTEGIEEGHPAKENLILDEFTELNCLDAIPRDPIKRIRCSDANKPGLEQFPTCLGKVFTSDMTIHDMSAVSLMWRSLLCRIPAQTNSKLSRSSHVWS